MLSMQHGNAHMVYFWKGASHFIKAQFNDEPITAAEIQREMGIGGETVTINSKEFIILKATIYRVTLHHDIKSDNLTTAQFHHNFEKN